MKPLEIEKRFVRLQKKHDTTPEELYQLGHMVVLMMQYAETNETSETDVDKSVNKVDTAG
jgi:hypothetical protein